MGRIIHDNCDFSGKNIAIFTGKNDILTYYGPRAHLMLYLLQIKWCESEKKIWQFFRGFAVVLASSTARKIKFAASKVFFSVV